MTGPQLGKEALLDAAARLFDEEGVDAVSLGMINRASGHRNRSAANYHFGDKESIIRAVVERATVEPDRRRTELLEALEASDPSPSARAVLEVMLTPATEALDDLDGRRHLRLLGQVVGHPRYFAATQDVTQYLPSLARCAEHLTSHLDALPEDLRVERVAVLSALAVRAYADQARLIDAIHRARPCLSPQRFQENLIAMILAAFVADPAT